MAPGGPGKRGDKQPACYAVAQAFDHTMLKSPIPILYVQLSPHRLDVRNARSGGTWSGAPELAVQQEPKPTILAVGDSARQAAAQTGARLVNPLDHPCSIISDYTLAEQLLRHAVQHVLRSGGSTWVLAPSPHLVLHPPSDPAGGYTQVELRALRELGMGSGASKVTLWHGAPLSDEDLRSGNFPATGQVLQA